MGRYRGRVDGCRSATASEVNGPSYVVAAKAESADVADALHEPRDESSLVHLARRNGPHCAARLSIRGLERKSVISKEENCARQRSPLVPVVKRMVLRDAERIRSGTLGRAGVLVPVLGDRPTERRLQERPITNSGAAAELRRQSRMHREDRRRLDPER